MWKKWMMYLLKVAFEAKIKKKKKEKEECH